MCHRPSVCGLSNSRAHTSAAKREDNEQRITDDTAHVTHFCRLSLFVGTAGAGSPRGRRPQLPVAANQLQPRRDLLVDPLGGLQVIDTTRARDGVITA